MDLSYMNEDQLMERFKDGEDQAFTALYDKLYPGLLAKAYFILEDQQLAEDAVQEVFTTVLIKRDMTTITTNAKGYFYIAIRNECLNMKRKAKRTTFRENMASLMEDVLDYRVMDSLEIKELRKMLIEAYRAIKLNKIAFDKFYFEELSQKQIAAELGKREGTIKKQISRVVAQLRENLKKGL